MGNISRRHHWFHRKMMSAKWVQKFHTDDMSIPRSGSAFWLVEANFQPIRRATQIWVMKGHQYGIFVLISQTSFCRETSRCLVKCWLISQAVIRKGGNDYMNVFLTVCITSILPLYSGTPLMATSVTWSPRYYGHFFLRAIHFLMKKTLLRWPPVNMANGHVLKSQTMESIIISPH